jgi:5'(3')-deoxyribonucleotidase
MKRLDIAVDLDQVGYPFVQVFRSWAILGHQYDSTLTQTPLREWEFYRDWGMTDEQFLWFFKTGVNAERIFQWGEPLPGFVEGIAELREAGHGVHIVTDRLNIGRPGLAVKNTHEWLAKFNIKVDSVWFTGDKRLINCDLAIDDSPRHLLDYIERKVWTVKMAYPYNRDIQADAAVKNFGDFIKYAAFIAKYIEEKDS